MEDSWEDGEGIGAVDTPFKDKMDQLEDDRSVSTSDFLREDGIAIDRCVGIPCVSHLYQYPPYFRSLASTKMANHLLLHLLQTYLSFHPLLQK